MSSNKKVNTLAQINKSILLVSLLLEKTKKNSNQIGVFRLLVFFSSIFIFLITYYLLSLTISVLFLLFFIVVFIFISVKQTKILFLIKKYNAWLDFKRLQLAKANLDWDGIPKIKEESDVPSSLEMDLDLIGDFSLHRLLNFTKLKSAREFLRNLLSKTPQNSEIIFHRQQIIKELITLSHFRNKYLLIANLSTNKEIDLDVFSKWLNKNDKEKTLKKKYSLLAVLCSINVLVIIFSLVGIIPQFWSITTALYWGVYLLNSKYVKSITFDAEITNTELKKIVNQIAFIENYKFGNNTSLEKLTSSIRNCTNSPTKLINKINGVLDIASFRANPFLWPLIVTLWPIDYYLGYKIEIYKKEIKTNLNEWLHALTELEAFISIANYAYLNPDYKFPIIEECEKEKILIEATKLGHPLIHYSKNVKNNFSVEGKGEIFIITGSNMSGKSTFLRTIGINICLAYSGAPVSADCFRMNLFNLFSCIKVSDSVVDGISYFYAEVKRLKSLLDVLNVNGELPVFFLIDEIFKGTNNYERLIGSKSLIKMLSEKKGSGIVSTHDLELVKLADETNSIHNYHFKEEIVNEKMEFDYKLNMGPCPTTNALKIMELNGLPTK